MFSSNASHSVAEPFFVFNRPENFFTFLERPFEEVMNRTPEDYRFGEAGRGDQLSQLQFKAFIESRTYKPGFLAEHLSALLLSKVEEQRKSFKEQGGFLLPEGTHDAKRASWDPSPSGALPQEPAVAPRQSILTPLKSKTDRRRTFTPLGAYLFLKP